jgi:hypothetical protein
MFKKAAMNAIWERQGYRYSEAASANFHTLALKSEAGMAMEHKVSGEGFLKVGADMHSKYPRRHGHD